MPCPIVAIRASSQDAKKEQWPYNTLLSAATGRDSFVESERRGSVGKAEINTVPAKFRVPQSFVRNQKPDLLFDLWPTSIFPCFLAFEGNRHQAKSVSVNGSDVRGSNHEFRLSSGSYAESHRHYYKQEEAALHLIQGISGS